MFKLLRLFGFRDFSFLPLDQWVHSLRLLRLPLDAFSAGLTFSIPLVDLVSWF